MLSNRITLKQLQAFASVVDEGSFRRAADALGTTQPNISARIASLEAALGTVLLHRDTRMQDLTETGHRVLRATRTTLAACEGVLDAAGRRDLIEDRLRLGVSELIACTWLHDLLRRFRAAYPAVSVELEVDRAAAITRARRAGDLDLALCTGPEREPNAPAFPYIWAATPQLTDKRQGRSLRQMLDGPVLVHSKQAAASRALLSEARAQGIPIASVVHSSSLASCQQMTLDGMGVGLLPLALAARALADADLVRLDCAWHPDPMWFRADHDAGASAGFVRAAAALAREEAARHGSGS